MSELIDIAKMPRILNNTHESCYRVSSILDKVLEMIERGDSKETIQEVVTFLSESPDLEFSKCEASDE